jgi:hypothetical protein
MSRRDKYIRAALTGLLSNSFSDGQTWEKIAETAVYIADAAIAAADAIKPVEVEAEAVAEDGEPKVGNWCMFRDHESTKWDGPYKLSEILGSSYVYRYRNKWSWWRHCRKATAEEIASK